MTPILFYMPSFTSSLWLQWCRLPWQPSLSWRTCMCFLPQTVTLKTWVSLAVPVGRRGCCVSSSAPASFLSYYLFMNARWVTCPFPGHHVAWNKTRGEMWNNDRKSINMNWYVEKHFICCARGSYRLRCFHLWIKFSSCVRLHCPLLSILTSGSYALDERKDPRWKWGLNGQYK